MKKVLCAVMLLLGLGICSSCDKEGGSAGGGSWIVGDWATVYDDGTTDYYLSFSREGIMTIRYAYTLEPWIVGGIVIQEDYFYKDARGLFDNGTLYSAPDVIWDKEYELEYKITDGQLIAAGFVMGPVKKINNDKFVLEGDSDYSCTYVRIKSFKTQTK